MKSLITAAAAVAVLAAVPAAVQAQPIGSEVYGSVGYAQSRSDGLDLGAIQGRAGVKINEYFGVEGELALG
ncbi:MAG: autotransporter, partial [Phenylobacterium sp.]|nr:autotransporter [Phenylobacterium sp.]